MEAAHRLESLAHEHHYPPVRRMRDWR